MRLLCNGTESCLDPAVANCTLVYVLNSDGICTVVSEELLVCEEWMFTYSLPLNTCVSVSTLFEKLRPEESIVNREIDVLKLLGPINDGLIVVCGVPVSLHSNSAMSSYVVILSIFLVERNCLSLSKVTSTLHVIADLGKVIFAWALRPSLFSCLGHLYDGWSFICLRDLLSWRKVLIVKWTVRWRSNVADVVSVVCFHVCFCEHQRREIVYCVKFALLDVNRLCYGGHHHRRDEKSFSHFRESDF